MTLYSVRRSESRGDVEDAYVLGVEILMLRCSGFPHGTIGTFRESFVPSCDVHLHVFCCSSLPDDVIYIYHSVLYTSSAGL